MLGADQLQQGPRRPSSTEHSLLLAPTQTSSITMETRLLSCLLAVAHLSLAQQFPPYVQFQGNRSAPNRGISPDVREALVQADANPNASHTVSFSSPGGGDWNWTLQISTVGVPAISNNTPDAHVAYTTWHFSGTDEEAMTAERAKSYPVCAYLMDINFPYNVSSRWDSTNSSCVSALGPACESALSKALITDNCDSQNALLLNRDDCPGMLGGGPREFNGILTLWIRMFGPIDYCAITAYTDPPTFRSIRRRQRNRWRVGIRSGSIL